MRITIDIEDGGTRPNASVQTAAQPDATALPGSASPDGGTALDAGACADPAAAAFFAAAGGTNGVEAAATSAGAAPAIQPP